jgi:hypothetical protein
MGDAPRLTASSGVITALTMMLLALQASSCKPAHFRVNTANEYQGWQVYRGWDFTFKLPPGFTVQKSTIIDFTLYRVSRGESDIPFLGIYSGSYPSFGKLAPRSARITRASIGTLPAETVEWVDSGGGHSREVKVTLHSGYLLHLWYEGLSTDDASLADSIIASVAYDPDAQPQD